MDCTGPKHGLALPRLTLKYLESLIVYEDYHHFPRTRTTVCTVELESGYTETQHVVCANIELYSEQIGRQRAKKKVLEEIQRKEYYALRKNLHQLRKPTEGSEHGN